MSEAKARHAFESGCEFIEEKLRGRDNRAIAAASFDKCIIGREGLEIPLLFANKITRQTHTEVERWRPGASLYTQADTDNHQQPILYIPYKSKHSHHYNQEQDTENRPSVLVGLAWGACLVVAASVILVF